MKTLFVAACCAVLSGCATSAPYQSLATAYVAPDGMRTYRPLPREERRVSECTMNVATRVATCR